MGERVLFLKITLLLRLKKEDHRIGSLVEGPRRVSQGKENREIKSSEDGGDDAFDE